MCIVVKVVTVEVVVVSVRWGWYRFRCGTGRSCKVFIEAAGAVVCSFLFFLRAAVRCLEEFFFLFLGPLSTRCGQSRAFIFQLFMEV